MTAFQAEGCGIALTGDEFYSFPSVLHTGARPSAQYNDVGGHPYRHFDRSGVEKSHSTMVHEALGQEIFGLRASYCLKPLPPIPARSPARDDDVGGCHWTRLRCEGSEGVVAADAASFKGGDEFYNAVTCFDAWGTF